MKRLTRWGRFMAVGAMGVAVQLAALAVFSGWLGAHYLWASAVALELTLLHNFAWHLRYTWADRRKDGPWLQALVRFHLSTGAVSMVGNLVAMWLLVQQAHLPVLVANVAAIACCGVANFWLGDVWTFAGTHEAKAVSRWLRVGSLPLALLAILLASPTAHAQTEMEDQQVDAPVTQAKQAPVPRHHGNETYLYHVGAFCGVGSSVSSVATKPTGGCGAGMTLIPIPVFVEVGVMGPQANRSYLSGYVSVDGSIPLARTSSTYLPLAIFGYSRLFETGHALNYGLALALPRPGKRSDTSKSLRLELRDYWTFANPAQHNIMLRIGWMGVETD